MQRKKAGGLLQTGLETASQCRMWADRVIEGLQVGEYIGLCTGPGGILFEMDQLAHETAEKFSATALS